VKKQITPKYNDFLEQKDPDLHMCLIKNLRVHGYDAPEVANGIAYTCVGIQFIDPPKKYKWMHLRHTLSSLSKTAKVFRNSFFLNRYF